MNVLSLFDGISSGRLALNKAGVEYHKYYASEIDKYATAVTRYNFPDTVFMGDVRNLEARDFEKIDLLIGGSPCQGFSHAGRKLNFQDPRSRLFFEFVRLLRALKPKYFLLENVHMKQEWQDVVSSYLGVRPLLINSSIVSAQNRKRLYWTNIPIKSLPADKNLTIKDIMEDETDEKYYIDKHFEIIKEKSNKPSLCKCIAKLDIKGQDIIKRIYSVEGKSPALTTM